MTRAAGAAAAALALVPALVPTARAAGDAGCDARRPAIAHHAGGAVLHPQPDGAPVPCMTFTGPTTDSAAIGVTRAGTAFYGPVEAMPGLVPAPAKIVMPTIVARSTDLGAHWENVVPAAPGAPASSHGGLTDWLSVDPDTSRVWYATPAAPCGASVSWSDDDGLTWSDNLDVGCPAQGANELIEGPAPKGGAQPAGYPHVVYYCANAGEVPLGDQSFLACHRSLDGGQTFRFVGGTPDKVPPSSRCGTVVRETRPGVVGHDGNLYFPQNVCGADRALRLAVSRDEGATWTYRPVLAAAIGDLYPPAIAADAVDDLYLAYKSASGLPYLTISRDRGASWSAPLSVAAPGVRETRRLAITARDAGHIAISYLGSTDGGTTFNAYITESRDALAASPVFWSAPVDRPGRPVALGTESSTFGDRIQFLSDTIAADGTPWAAFHCARTPLCPGARVGIAGRLAR